MASTQPTLFDPHRNQLTTSAVAKQQIEASGTAAADRAFAVELVRAYPGKTASELENKVGCRDGKVRKRLAECVPEDLRRGAVKPCDITGRDCVTWWPVN